ncbi:MAG: hypothetical protein H0Z19_08800 [Archaeoglobus sp.]|uniref:hypothetical protein n=1 Tax=Archaeoglobus sp. TaxID=1872626 RepID=UPI001DAF2CFD|nr:hypothetical protein [Archaeoglobus sp.]MBO8180556.1 hypothetical protein [Archaeoglobus sp.]
MEAVEETDTNSKIADKILENLMRVYSIDEIMQTVRKNKDKSIYLCVKRSKPESPKIFVDSNGNHCYRCDETLMIPIPKKFVILEPDKLYFEMTLRANIMLALNGAEERELHH